MHYTGKYNHQLLIAVASLVLALSNHVCHMECPKALNSTMLQVA